MTYSPEIGRKFWYEFDKATKYTPSFMSIVGRAGVLRIQAVFSDTRLEGRYPDDFVRSVTPHKEDWKLLVKVQRDAIKTFLGDDWTDIQSAFEDFGQGVLLDTAPERITNDDAIHTMDIQGAGPPIGYHRWHASIRAIQLLGIDDNAWWERLDTMLGLAWGIQSFATPKQQAVANPRIAREDLVDLRNAWLPLAPEQRDRQYDLTGTSGYHPNPKLPVA